MTGSLPPAAWRVCSCKAPGTRAAVASVSSVTSSTNTLTWHFSNKWPKPVGTRSQQLSRYQEQCLTQNCLETKFSDNPRDTRHTHKMPRGLRKCFVCSKEKGNPKRAATRSQGFPRRHMRGWERQGRVPTNPKLLQCKPQQGRLVAPQMPPKCPRAEELC